MTINRWNRFKFKNGKITKNRIVVPAMASQTADENGFATQKTILHYQRLASSGAGLIFVEYSFIHQSGKSESNQLGADAENKKEGLEKIVSVIHQSGALAGFQIVHAGGKSSSQITRGPLMGPSALSVPVKGQALEVPIAFLESQIEDYVTWFVDSAHLAYTAGFDFVEIHAAHGYGINQWLSPITNQRSDLYGKDISGRSIILLAIVARIKKEIPAILVSVRIPGQDHLEDGLKLSEMIWVAQKLEATGVDLINVSSGIGGWKRPPGKHGEGYLVHDASMIKKHISIPVIGVGGIESGYFIDEVIKEKKIDFAAVGRAILKSPTEWSEKNLWCLTRTL